MKVIAAQHVFDGVQVGLKFKKIIKLWISFFFEKGIANGIVRSVGGQFYGSIFFLIGFYIVGTPIGLGLLLKTPLMTYGFLLALNMF